MQHVSKNIIKKTVNIILRGSLIERIFGIFEWVDFYNKLDPKIKKTINYNLIWIKMPIPSFIKLKLLNRLAKADKNLLYPSNLLLLREQKNIPDIWWGLRDTILKPIKIKAIEWILVYLSDMTETETNKLIDRLNGFHPHGGFILTGDTQLIDTTKLNMQYVILDYDKLEDLEAILCSGIFISPKRDLISNFFNLVKNTNIIIKRV